MNLFHTREHLIQASKSGENIQIPSELCIQVHPVISRNGLELQVSVSHGYFIYGVSITDGKDVRFHSIGPTSASVGPSSTAQINVGIQLEKKCSEEVSMVVQAHVRTSQHTSMIVVSTTFKYFPQFAFFQSIKNSDGTVPESNVTVDIQQTPRQVRYKYISYQ